MPYTSSARFTWADEAQRSGMRGCVANTPNAYGNMGVYRGAVNGTDNERVPAAWTAENALQLTTDAWALLAPPLYAYMLTARCCKASFAEPHLVGSDPLRRGVCPALTGLGGTLVMPPANRKARRPRRAAATRQTHIPPPIATSVRPGQSSSALMGCLLTDRLASSSAAAFQSTCRTCYAVILGMPVSFASTLTIVFS